MKEEPKDSYQEEKAKKEFLIFDRGLSELTVSKEKEIKRKINWFTLYKILFKNILNSKDVIPIDELTLRFNIIRSSLPKYYKGYKGNDSNSSAIIKKFTYHICKSKKKPINIFKLRQKSEERKKINPFQKLNSEGNINVRKRSLQRTKTVKLSNKLNLDFLNKDKNKINSNRKYLNDVGLEVLPENEDFSTDRKKYNDKKRLTINEKSPLKNSIKKASNSNKKEKEKETKNRTNLKIPNTPIKFKELNNSFNLDEDKTNKKEKNEIILGTPTDSEFPLVLSQKRLYNTKPSFFFESVNKIKEQTKEEKIKTFQKEFTSQILKFNDLYFDPKIDDFYNDKLFNDVKATCDLFINKFKIDSEEEKNLADLDNYI
jgi:hypothetical protein